MLPSVISQGGCVNKRPAHRKAVPQFPRCWYCEGDIIADQVLANELDLCDLQSYAACIATLQPLNGIESHFVIQANKKWYS